MEWWTSARLVPPSVSRYLTNRENLFNIEEDNNKQTPHQTRKNKFSIRSLQHPRRQTKPSGSIQQGARFINPSSDEKKLVKLVHF